MIDTMRNVTRKLHDEHMTVIALLERFSGFLRRQGDRPPAADGGAAGMLGELSAALGGEISDHFAFEEESLFPRLAAAGEAGFGVMLSEDHGEIRPVAARLIELADAGRAGGFCIADWAEFRRLGALLIERLGEHVQKEEFGLLPALEDVLDDAEDAQLAEQYQLQH
jgi:hypothetical protein